MFKNKVSVFVLFSFVILFVYVLALTANFNRLTYFPNEVFGLLVFVYIIFVIINVVYFIISFKMNFKSIPLLLLFSNILMFLHVGYEFTKPTLYKGWIKPEIMVSEVIMDPELEISYRFKTENFKQKNRKFYFEVLVDSQVVKDIEIQKIGDKIKPYLFFSGKDSQYSFDVKKLLPNSISMLLIKKPDSLLYYLNFDINEIEVSYIDLNKNQAVYLRTIRGNIIQDSIKSVPN